MGDDNPIAAKSGDAAALVNKKSPSATASLTLIVLALGMVGCRCGLIWRMAVVVVAREKVKLVVAPTIPARASPAATLTTSDAVMGSAASTTLYETTSKASRDTAPSVISPFMARV